MKIGEVSLLTNDVVRLADFYKKLLDIENESNDVVHQTIIAEETMFTIYNDGTLKENNNTNMCLAFTVQDLDLEYERLKELGVDIISEPKKQPWGAYNMSFYDPDRNIVYLRQLYDK
jgi:predicted enzyme related to lactoylglutathione lyase